MDGFKWGTVFAVALGVAISGVIVMAGSKAYDAVKGATKS